MPSSYLQLPEELKVDILSRLDLKDVLRCKCISKSWYALLSGPYFMEKHVQRIESSANFSLVIKESWSAGVPYKVDLNHDNALVEYNAVKLDDPPFELQSEVGSCNGLVCLSDLSNRVTIWNPSTRTFLKLPSRPIRYDGVEVKIQNYRAYGFGHDRVTDDYKVIGIAEIHRRHDFELLGFEARVYSLKNGSWAKKSCLNKKLRLAYTEFGTYASVSNAIYWIMEHNQRYLIGAFDLGIDNGYHEVQMPDYEPKNGSHYKTDIFPRSLGVLRGCLCLFSTSFVYSSDLWVMKESWIKLVSFPPLIYKKIRPLTYSRSGTKVLFHDCFNYKLIWYDLKTKSGTVVKLQEDLRVEEVFVSALTRSIQHQS